MLLSFVNNSTTVFMMLGNGYSAFGHSAPTALIHANNNNIWSKFLVKVGHDKAGAGMTVPDSMNFAVTGSGKVIFGKSAGVDGKSALADTALANFVVSETVTAWDSSKKHNEASIIADDGVIVIATSVAGRGSVQIGNNEQWAWFTFNSSGDVTLVQNSAKVSKTASAGDDSLMIYDAGDGIAIKNRLGDKKVIDIDIHYFSP